MKHMIVTGRTGLSAGILQEFDSDYRVEQVSRRSRHDIQQVAEWAQDFADADVLINCAYSEWAQVAVLEQFCQLWDSSDKTIVNIGSMVSDYSRSEQHRDHEYFPYRLHKQALQTAFERMVKNTKCNLKLINPGMIDTPMVQHIEGEKLSVHRVAQYVRMLVETPELKRLDLWQ